MMCWMTCTELDDVNAEIYKSDLDLLSWVTDTWKKPGVDWMNPGLEYVLEVLGY